MFSQCFRLYSSLEKVMPDRLPDGEELTEGSMLSNERFSFQAAYTLDRVDGKRRRSRFLYCRVESELQPFLRVRRVGYVPSELPVILNGNETEEELDSLIGRGRPGLYPDPLYTLEGQELECLTGGYDALWITVDPKNQAKPGSYEIRITFSYRAEGETEQDEECTKIFRLEILPAALPEQKTVVTQWFHGDCLSTYYKIPVFSEEHWEIMERFIRTAADNGINMLLTPLFTPPLDTKIGGQRPTIQLVDVTYDGKKYRFGFDKLKRWVKLCQSCGIRYFEMCHLYTQWGAKFCPKIMAWVNGEEKQIFGWEVSATSEAYREFLAAFLPELTAFLRAEGLEKNACFHISDEPSAEHRESYLAARKQAEPYLQGFPIMDAMSELEFYQQGIVTFPVPNVESIEPFRQAGTDPLWTYYCIAENSSLPNRFFAYPSWKNRILGVLMYKYRIQGFLQWGYNFYYTRHSTRAVDPFRVTDAGRAFPSGDAFLVYPGEEECIESLRLAVFYEAMQDIRALELLESRIGREKTLALIEKTAGRDITFRDYPQNGEFLLELREKVNREIQKFA